MARSLFLALALLIAGPVFAQTDTALKYYDRDHTGQTQPYRLPVQVSSTSGPHTITDYAMRFTSPFGTTFLDSVRIRMEVTSLAFDESIYVGAYGPSFESSGVYLDGTQEFALEALGLEDVFLQETRDYTIDMASVEVSKDFFISVGVSDDATLQLIGDNIASSTLLARVEDRDRSRMYAFEDGYQDYIAGTTFSGQPPYLYPNFYITAYVSTFGASSVASVRTLNHSLKQNFPNPFNPSTTIRFELKQPSRAQLEVRDAMGNVVATVLDEQLPAGEYDRVFDASGLPSGTYIYTLRAGDERSSRPMVLTK